MAAFRIESKAVYSITNSVERAVSNSSNAFVNSCFEQCGRKHRKDAGWPTLNFCIPRSPRSVTALILLLVRGRKRRRRCNSVSFRRKRIFFSSSWNIAAACWHCNLSSAEATQLRSEFHLHSRDQETEPRSIQVRSARQRIALRSILNYSCQDRSKVTDRTSATSLASKRGHLKIYKCVEDLR